MSRRFTPKVVTANALVEGDVVYLTADDRWSRDMHHEAELIEDEAEARCGCCTRTRSATWSSAPIWPTPAPARAAPSRCISARRSAPAAPSNYAHGKQADLTLR
jgi:hypothetical protein